MVILNQPWADLYHWPRGICIENKKGQIDLHNDVVFSHKNSQSTQVILPRKLINFQNIIATEEKLMLFLHKRTVYYINTENQKILYKFFYNLSSYELRVLHEYLNNALIKNWIQYSVSSIESSILFVFKRNGSLWLYVNYQNLNKKIIKNCHPLLLIEETLNHLMEFYYFIKLNLKNAYHWIWIAEKNHWKTIFYIRYEHFEYLIILFNLANVSIIFQVYINETLQHLINIICIIYLNDILIYSATQKQHIKNICAVFL